ncbi:MAG: gamma-glutamylcyclotransferase [Hyphomonadaceae bacterium]|nr:gamma-glutamylcyclotransferase [Hyphomonadaceae bacterium]
MTPNLFVYGTLLSTAGHRMGARLRREARLIGEATIRGRLYRITRYPGLVEGSDLDARVHGEVYLLRSPAVALQWLDAYEGIVPGTRNQNEYERVQRSVCLTSGEHLTAWVFLYRESVARRHPIPGGRWVPAAP